MKYLYRDSEADAQRCLEEYKAQGYLGYVVGKTSDRWELRVWQ